MTRIFTLPLVLAAACGGTRAQPSTVAPALTARIINSTGAGVGSASLLPSSRGPLLVLKLQSVPPGTHGLHVHATGQCDTPAFESAGPHLNPANRKHGARNPAGPHAGDLPNVRAGADSMIDTTFVLAAELLAEGALGAGAPPRALVLHAQADDLATDPSGNSGDRIACGVLGR